MAGNSHLARLGARGVVEPTGRVKREPKRYATAERKAERTGPAVETLRLFVCEPLDVSSDSVAVRAIGDLQPGTCRRPFGAMQHLTFCGARATVIVAGALTYCAACAVDMGWDKQAWQRSQDAMRRHLGGMA